VGPNAAGKTNIIEAISTVATGASFRNPRWDEVVRWDAPEALVAMSAEGEGSHVEVEMRVTADGTRSWRVNGVHRRRTADATRFVPIVAFTPDDLLLVKGPADLRRGAVDTLGEQLSASFGALRRDYTRVVKQRNALLRDEASVAELAAWDEQLIHLGARLHTHRRGLARRIIDAAAPVYEHLSDGEALTLRLADRCGTGCDDVAIDLERAQVERSLRAELDRRRPDESARKVSLVGPHRDDLVFEVNGHDARSYASQGQQRTIALAFKLAEVSVVSEVLRRAPVLLLDDVMSELDEARRAALTDLVQREIQTFVTSTTTGYFDPELLRSALIVPVGGES
jgi:DNA replication and repair protein RecF